MSLLTDTDLKKWLIDTDETKRLVIKDFNPEYLTPVGYDLRIGNFYSSRKSGDHKIFKNQDVVIRPFDTVLITTLENIVMPKNKKMSALINSKVTLVSQGLSHISTTIDADWQGHLLIALNNHTPKKIKLKYGDPFCTAVFFKNESSADGECEKEPNRIDILMKKWSLTNKKTKKKELLTKILTLLVIPVSFLIGFLIWGNNPSIVAITAASIAISQFIWLQGK